MGPGGPRTRCLSSAPPAGARGGTPLALPCLGQFGPQKSVRELSARARAPRGAGWARPTRSPTRPATPRPHAPHTRPARPPGRLPRPSLALPLLLFSPLAGRRADGGDPAGTEASAWRTTRPRPRPPRHVLDQRRQQSLPPAPPGLEQRLPAAGEGAAGPVFTSQNVEALDPRGRTLLHLAVSLGHLESARVLLRHKADVTKENGQGWTVLHEAVSTGDPEMVYTVLQHRDYHNTSMALEGVPELLHKILEAPDFYVQMKWEFTSWVPLVSRICPNDVCRIWKSGAKLRVDITLLGFENMSWIRGRRSFIFKGEDNWAELMEVNHDDKVVTSEHFDLSQEMERLTLDLMKPKSREVERRLTSPVINTSLDTKNIAFERTKSGFWGWRTDKAEVVNGYEAKVYTVNNVNVITKIRTEHLTEEEKKRYKADRNPLESLLGTVEHQFGAQGDLTTECATANNPTAITPEEYFSEEFDLKDRDIGRPKELTIRTQKFKAMLWMCEEFPLSLVEQVIPIIDLMARTSAHFARLRDFIKLEFPPGFPVKIEIPLFHVLNARITFGNVNGCSTAEETQNEGTQADSASQVTNFEVDQSVFEIPESYHIQDNGRNVHLQDEDYEIMQFAIQQSLLESSRSPELSGPASNGGISPTQSYEAQYERAIQESLLTSTEGLCADALRDTSRFDSDLQLAMELSAKELEEQELRLQEEEAELQQVLQLSLTEK
ncbi:ankyrin repeat domain-containing protein 13A isoform X2 [Marmota marmota marmota]|uniref:ankyrin repeat domain-containing protein 13A isoform X2 n=1 Tax=Marmota marmota marmota TaxID=9994 RepID=UPI0020934F09|nr:ankyrin repeat domain-containing protein 13A isoform X2 [Marmota marmota marmota]